VDFREQRKGLLHRWIRFFLLLLAAHVLYYIVDADVGAVVITYTYGVFVRG